MTKASEEKRSRFKPVAADEPHEGRRALPSVERLLSSDLGRSLSDQYGRDSVKQAVVASLEEMRRQPESADPSLDAVLEQARGKLAFTFSSSLRRVINGTGILIHTNLGRCPIDPEILRRAEELVSRYSNLEFDLEKGARGSRDSHISQIASELFGCEDAILTNNNAAGTLLLLAAQAAGREVIVSRGELVEIGGSFRVPDVIQQGGARLREVGTTNRTRAADYSLALSESTAAILRVSRSNFDLVGFTESPSVGELVEVARTAGIPFLYDEGSGRVADLAVYGFAKRETIGQHIRAGVDAIACSTDKLIGATQGGLILGRKELIDRCRRHPLMRALRVGKETYGIVAETLRAFLAGKQEELIPIYRMLAQPGEGLRSRASAIAENAGAHLVSTRSALGGGTTPAETIESWGVAVPGKADRVANALLRSPIPIVGRIQADAFLIDVRTLFPEEDSIVIDAIRSWIGEQSF